MVEDINQLSEEQRRQRVHPEVIRDREETSETYDKDWSKPGPFNEEFKTQTFMVRKDPDDESSEYVAKYRDIQPGTSDKDGDVFFGNARLEGKW